MYINTVEELLETLYQKRGKKKRKVIARIEHTASVRAAAVEMEEKGINFLMVTKNRKPFGVVSTSDTSAELGSSVRPSERMIWEIMTPKDKVVTVSVDDNLMDLPKRFDLGEHKIRHLVVCNKEGRWVAILDTNEVLEAVMENIAHDERIQAYLSAESRRRD